MIPPPVWFLSMKNLIKRYRYIYLPLLSFTTFEHGPLQGEPLLGTLTLESPIRQKQENNFFLSVITFFFFFWNFGNRVSRYKLWEQDLNTKLNLSPSTSGLLQSPLADSGPSKLQWLAVAEEGWEEKPKLALVSCHCCFGFLLFKNIRNPKSSKVDV